MWMILIDENSMQYDEQQVENKDTVDSLFVCIFSSFVK